MDLPISEIDADLLEQYVVYLKDSRKMADSSRKNHLAVLTSFFRTASKRLKVLDPSQELDEMRFHSPAPKRSFLTRREADLLLASIDTEKTLGLRDHAVFSVMLYAGLRIEEVTALTTSDVDFSCGEEEIRVAKGKGNKERRVPVGAKLKKSLKRYLRVRQQLVAVTTDDPGLLFLNNKGNRLTENTVRRTLYKYVRKSGIRKTDLHPHDLRRTFAFSGNEVRSLRRAEGEGRGGEAVMLAQWKSPILSMQANRKTAPSQPRSQYQRHLPSRRLCSHALLRFFPLLVRLT